MQRAIVILLATLAAVVLAEGQYYVPRAYYTIDPNGHESVPVPLRRLRRSINPNMIPYPINAASAHANSDAWSGGSANAGANANARATVGAWGLPSFTNYGSSNPNLVRH